MPKLQAKFLQSVPQGIIDMNPGFKYSSFCEEEDFEEMKEVPKSEFIFVIDRSGSMLGQRIQLAIEALTLLIHSLPFGSKFNVVSFGSDHKFMFPKSVDYTEENVEAADKMLAKFDAEMGGTEIFNPLKDVFAQEQFPGLQKTVFLLTDGGVANTSDVIELI
mmetsp:Transcript_48586/g.35760  ORF Transcript_48586/g.35760 Transcript_48586/m.35760 type:complete len:162 (-) Transcript_48586:1382-1867(-)